jgi:hypothetical protein
MAVHVQHKRGTAARWYSVNPILMDGEFGYEKDTKMYKVGDGTTAWRDLPYSSGPKGDTGDTKEFITSTSAPTSGDGVDGDIWFQYIP